jgi:hypothetical protein
MSYIIKIGTSVFCSMLPSLPCCWFICGIYQHGSWFCITALWLVRVIPERLLWWKRQRAYGRHSFFKVSDFIDFPLIFNICTDFIIFFSVNKCSRYFLSGHKRTSTVGYGMKRQNNLIVHLSINFIDYLSLLCWNRCIFFLIK